MNREFMGKHFADAPVRPWITVIVFHLVAIPMTILSLFLTYWLLPNCRVPVRRIAPVAFVVGLALTILQYIALLLWKWIIAKMKHDYGPFAHSASIILFSFLASMIVLAGAEWSARRPEKPDPARYNSPQKSKEKPVTDWKNLAAARGLQLSDAELTKLAAAMEALEPAYQALAANLTPDVEPSTTIAEEAVVNR